MHSGRASWKELHGWTKAPCSFAIVQKCCNFHQHSIKRRTNPCHWCRLICAVVARLAVYRSHERWRGPPGSRPLRKSGTSASPSDLDRAQARSPRVFTRIVVRPLAWQVLDAAASLSLSRLSDDRPEGAACVHPRARGPFESTQIQLAGSLAHSEACTPASFFPALHVVN